MPKLSNSNEIQSVKREDGVQKTSLGNTSERRHMPHTGHNIPCASLETPYPLNCNATGSGEIFIGTVCVIKHKDLGFMCCDRARDTHRHEVVHIVVGQSAKRPHM